MKSATYTHRESGVTVQYDVPTKAAECEGYDVYDIFSGWLAHRNFAPRITEAHNLGASADEIKRYCEANKGLKTKWPRFTLSADMLKRKQAEQNLINACNALTSEISKLALSGSLTVATQKGAVDAVCARYSVTAADMLNRINK